MTAGGFETAASIADAVNIGRKTALEVTRAALARIKGRNPVLNAFTAITEERALARAGRLDQTLARGGPPLTLAGVPFGEVVVGVLVVALGQTAVLAEVVDADDAVPIVEEMLDEVVPDAEPAEEDAERLKDLASEAPVIRLVNTMIAAALEKRASDIHIEPFEKEFRVRFRIDGVLWNQESPPRELKAAVISRLKLMAKLNIA